MIGLALGLGRAAFEEPTMAILTEHTSDRVVFATANEERTPGLLLLIHGGIFAGVPLWAAARHPMNGIAAALFLGLFVLIGLAEVAAGLHRLLRSERLALDLKGRAYAGHAKFLLWGRAWAGPLADFEQVRVRDVPLGRRGRHRRWVAEWVWADPGLPPFRVDGWGRLNSFRIVPRRRSIDSPESLRELRSIAREAGLPLILPDGFLARPGLDSLGPDPDAQG